MVSIKRVHVIVAASVVLAVGAGGAMATAATGDNRAPAAVTVAVAPYARAAAAVDSNGKLNRAKAITSAKRVSTGRYCVKVSAAGFDVRTSVPQVSLGLNSGANVSISVSRGIQPLCEKDTKSVFVQTKQGSALHDEIFLLTVA